MSYNYEDLSIGEIKDLMRQWRENNERRSEDVMEFWVTIMDDINKLGNEKYVILEQVLYAALDTHTYSVSKQCIAMLKQEFPGSLRVMRYRAAQLEAEERYEEALELLAAITKAEETHAAARKRRVALLKAQGLLSDAVKELVDYLKKFMSDVEAWQELCELYLQAGEYARAAFCAEELLLHQPHSHLHLQRLADIRYTMGGLENMELAKTYYCRAAKLNPDNMRALLGLFLASNNLLSHCRPAGGGGGGGGGHGGGGHGGGGHGGGGKRHELLKLCQWSQSQAAHAQQRALAGAAPPSPSAPAPAPAAPLARMLASLAIAE